MIRVREYQGLRVRHQVDLDMYSGQDAIALLDERESFAREQAERWEGTDWRLLVTRKNNHLIIRFMRRLAVTEFKDEWWREMYNLDYCDRWKDEQIDHYEIIS